MSLLSDFLSKIKHAEPKKDVPPALRSAVASLRRKESRKRRIIILSIISILAIMSGFLTAYIIQNLFIQGIIKDKPQRIASLEDKQLMEKQGENTTTTTPETKPVIIVEKPRSEEKTKYKTPPVVKRKSVKRSIIVPNIVPREKIKLEDIAQKQNDSELEVSGLKELYLYMGEDYEKKKDYYNAILSYKKVLDIEPENYRVMNKIAHIFIEIGLYEEATKYLKNTIDIKEDYVPALINYGIVYAKAENFFEAERYFLKALSIEAENQEALFNIALLYEKQGMHDLAQKYYSKLQKMGNAEGDRGLERIMTIK
ncbi:MAG: tetratricopeptide repeat protein [Nitrospirota bacterium]